MSPRIGIDPGLTGAIALLDGDVAIQVWDMPVVVEGTRKAVSGVLLADVVVEAAKAAEGRPTVVLESVSARPGQGVTSMFRFGQAVGVVEGVVGALGFTLVCVTPGVWKRRAGLLGKEKDASRGKAIALFPEMSGELKRKKDCGRAEAMLIAFFGTDA